VVECIISSASDAIDVYIRRHCIFSGSFMFSLVEGENSEGCAYICFEKI